MPIEEDKQGNTPMHYAAAAGLVDILLEFMERGGNPNTTNAHDQTSLHAVCGTGRHEADSLRCLEVLLSWKGMLIDGVQETTLVNATDKWGKTVRKL